MIHFPLPTLKRNRYHIFLVDGETKQGEEIVNFVKFRANENAFIGKVVDGIEKVLIKNISKKNF